MRKEPDVAMKPLNIRSNVLRKLVKEEGFVE